MMRRTPRGSTLIELVGALAIATLMLTGLAALIDNALEDAKAQTAAQYQSQFTAAAARYLSDHYADLLTSVASSASGTVPVKLSDLQVAHSYLPAGFAATNAYRQSPCMLVRSPAADRLDVLIVTEGPAGPPNDAKIPDKILAYAAANAGTGGGFISNDTPGDATTPRVARGAYGGWSLNNVELSKFTSKNCSGVAADVGHLASALYYGGTGQLAGDFLYRNPVSGQPKLNQMNTPIGFGVGATKVVGDACSSAALAADVNGNILRCDITTLKYVNATAATNWKSPVPTFAALPLTDSAGDVRIVIDPNLSSALDNPRAFVYTGSAWVALAVDEKGNLVTEGNVVIGGDLMAETGKVVGRNVTAFETVAAHNVYLTNTVYAAGTSCNVPDMTSSPPGIFLPPGSIVRDQYGNTMMCRVFSPHDPAVPGSGGIGILVYESRPP